jgi:hypothetical protein
MARAGCDSSCGTPLSKRAIRRDVATPVRCSPLRGEIGDDAVMMNCNPNRDTLTLTPKERARVQVPAAVAAAAA